MEKRWKPNSSKCDHCIWLIPFDYFKCHPHHSNIILSGCFQIVKIRWLRIILPPIAGSSWKRACCTPVASEVRLIPYFKILEEFTIYGNRLVTIIRKCIGGVYAAVLVPNRQVKSCRHYCLFTIEHLPGLVRVIRAWDVV